LIDQEELAES